jgi:DNA-directed RNA polymerase specialized sigma24 family protein
LSGTTSDLRSDEQLMAAYVAGDGAAFRVIFERYAPVLMRAMLRELYVREEANDLVQQTFLQLHRARADFDAGQKLKPWIFTIAMNLKREYFRRKKRRPERSLDAETPTSARSSSCTGSTGWSFRRWRRSSAPRSVP